MSSGVMSATRAPRLGKSSTRPSAARRPSASRTGVREIPSCAARSSCRSFAWCSRSPERMRSRSAEYARSTTLVTWSLLSPADTTDHLGGRDPAPQPLDAVEEVRAQALDRSGELDRRDPREQRLEGDAHLQAREVRAHAEVHAARTEGHVRVGGAGHVEALAVGEVVLVAVARYQPRRHLVAAADQLAAELDVLGRRAAEVVDGRRPPQHLLGGRRVQVGLAAQALELVGELDEAE